MAFVVLCGNLSKNEELEDAIPRDYPEIDVCLANLSLVLLFLFLLWNYLSSLFIAERATLEIYKEFCWQVQGKYEPRLLPQVRFYAKNVYQVRKTRIEVRTDLARRANTCKAAQLEVENGRDNLSDMADNDGKAKIDSLNVGLVEFGIQTQTSLVDSIQKTRRKWVIDDFMKCSNNNFITSLIINIGAKSATQMEESFTISCCQVNKLDRPDIGNIDHVSEDVVLL